MVYSLQLFWVMNAYQAEDRLLAEEVIARAEALPPLEGAAAVRRKYLITRSLSTLTAVAISQGDTRSVDEFSARCEFYARDIGDKGLLARALSYRCAGRLSVGIIEEVENWSSEALQCARESDDAFALSFSLE
jgi:hypothetical protein